MPHCAMRRRGASALVLIGRTQYGTRDGIRLSLPSTQGMRLFVARMDVLYCYCLGERGRILQGSLLSKTESGLYASNSVPQAAKDSCAVRRRCYLTSQEPHDRDPHTMPAGLLPAAQSYRLGMTVRLSCTYRDATCLMMVPLWLPVRLLGHNVTVRSEGC
ncbi:hypothetical protein BDY17DRAFT_184478 [Neohortaea acidophila]|uniref:Uncharacterized protein n=1 Tax=Neohortaea acidophila TaxID=245834 RepID=A0A6A6PM88_9PEZI|nr:uncharacterized protein BDY17DRAFT_184478 [Neohortaea acidophila]KAF2481200.1 hypothetical protein BDY17DRAFT_184478 [Neohortaea acidophila]